MNKRLLVALLLPMMLLPMTAFGYAHWTDKVTKQIKMHAGTVEVEIVQWHVDACNSYDVDCDDVIWGDEFKVEMLEDDEGQVIELLITADPIYPGWYLEFKFLVHNKGRLVIRSFEHHVGWVGPEEVDPCFLGPEDQPYPDTPAPPGFVYTQELFLHDPTIVCPMPCLNKEHYTFAVEPTTYILKPCQSVLVKETINANIQDYLDYQCHWFRLAKEMVFVQEVGEMIESYGYP